MIISEEINRYFYLRTSAVGEPLPPTLEADTIEATVEAEARMQVGTGTYVMDGGRCRSCILACALVLVVTVPRGERRILLCPMSHCCEVCLPLGAWPSCLGSTPTGSVFPFLEGAKSLPGRSQVPCPC